MKTWAGTGEAYAASYASLCAGTEDAVLAALGDGEGRPALDAGAGTGGLAARMQARGWAAAGTEPEATMRAVARRSHPDLSFHDAALPDLPFVDGVFAAVTANFVLNHVADPRASAAEMARVAAPGGVLVATTWVVSPTWFWAEVCASAGLVPTAGERLPADKDFERTTSGFARMLVDGGWRDVDARELTWTWHAAPSALWASAVGGVAAAGQFYRALDDAGRTAFRHGFDAVCTRRGKADQSVPLEHTAAIVAGRPGA